MFPDKSFSRANRFFGKRGIENSTLASVDLFVDDAESVVILRISWPDLVEFAFFDVSFGVVDGLVGVGSVKEDAIGFEAKGISCAKG
jgi:hypothetical protein